MLTEEEVLAVATVCRWGSDEKHQRKDDITYANEYLAANPKPNSFILNRTREYYGIRNHSSMQVAQLVLTIQEALAAGDGILTRLRDPSSTG
jgi:hypothetical protein